MPASCDSLLSAWPNIIQAKGYELHYTRTPPLLAGLLAEVPVDEVRQHGNVQALPVASTFVRLDRKEKTMGMARLNIWITDLGDPCRMAQRDWVVAISNCEG